MVHLWRRMVATYGHRWSSQLGDSALDDDGRLTVAAETWQAGLAGMDADAMKRGLRSCRDSDDDWPPTLPRFRAYCEGRQIGRNGYGLDFTPECYRAGVTDKSRMLPGPGAEERREESLKKIREIRAMLS